MREIYRVRSDSALAAALQLGPSAPSNWRQRNRPPLGVCAWIAQTQGISLDWLVFGIGEKYACAGSQVRDAPDVAYQGSSEVAARIIRFLMMWDACRAPEEMIWLEQHLKRTVPEYGEWLDQPEEERA